MILQYISSLLMLGFGISGLLVSRRLLHPIAHRLAWRVAGTAFGLAGVTTVAQNIFGTFALVAGAGSPTWNLYLSWAPAFDHGRSGILATLFPLLVFLLVPHRSHAAVSASGYPAYRWATILIAGGSAGAVAGRMQGWDDIGHFRIVTIGDTTEMLLVLVSLFALLLRDRVDRLLWLALCLYALKLAMNVLWLSAWLQTSGTSDLFSLEHMHVSRIVLSGTMIGLALRRLALAARGTPVAGLISSLPMRSTFPRRMF